MTRWFEPSMQRALDDVWRELQAEFELVQSELLAWVEQHVERPRLQKVLTRATGGSRNRAVLQAAFAGNLEQYQREITNEGADYLASGVSLGAALDATRRFTLPLLPRLIQAYGAEPTRLSAAIQAMNEFAHRSVCALADSYRAHAEAALLAYWEDLAITFDSIGDGVIVTDAEGRVLRMNAVAEQLTGFESAECSGKDLEAVFRIENEETKQPVESPVRRVLREGVVVGLANHTELVAKDGSRRPIADSGAPIRRENGEVRGVVLVFRDVTEERKAEDALRHWQRIFQHATWGVATANVKDVKFQAVNPAYAEMHGYSVEELVGTPVSRLWAPETKADMERHAAETHGHGRLVVETTHLRKDGSRLPVEIIATTIKNAQGEIEWFVANVQDISERRALQQAKMRALELEVENKRVEEANRLKSEFLANMSHELRTPLNSIIGFAQLLHDEEVGRLQDKQKEFLGDILSGGLHLLRLINDVLDLAKVEAGKMEFRPEPVDLEFLVQSVVQGMHEGTAKGIRVTVSVNSALADVTLDPGRFKQLLYNYLSNALKFTPVGGAVKVSATPEDDRFFRIEVEDNGPGVAPEDAQRLFVPFQQLESGMSRRHGGTGLGLALTKRLAEAQGGRVGMRAASPHGSIFFAVLPRKPLEPVEPTALLPLLERDGVSPTRGRQVLVVDDDAASLKLMQATLAKRGHEALCFSRAADALAALPRMRPLAVVADLLMPGMDGFTFLDRFRSSPGNSSVPVMIWTVKDLSPEERRRLGECVQAVVQKGTGDDQVLAAALNALLPAADSLATIERP